MGCVNLAIAHDILGGQLDAIGTHGTNQQAIDVFRTTCFSWGDGVHDTVAGAGQTGVQTAGAATGFRFSVNLQNTSSGSNPRVTASVGYTAGGNVNGSTCPAGSPSNCLPANTFTPAWSSTTDSSVGAPWNQGGAEADFATNGNAPAGWATAKWLPAGNGDYVIVIQNTSVTAGTTANYDFVGHCQNASTGTKSLIHTGQGTWFVTNGGGLLTPTSDYDQVINETY